jgi:hypothetical protein
LEETGKTFDELQGRGRRRTGGSGSPSCKLSSRVGRDRSTGTNS